MDATHLCSCLPQPGKRGRLCVESALPAIAPMLPSDRNGRGWGEYAQELSESRLPYIIINVLKLLTTLVIIALPADFWLPTYVALTFPLRFVCTTRCVEGGCASSPNIQSSTHPPPPPIRLAAV